MLVVAIGVWIIVGILSGLLAIRSISRGVSRKRLNAIFLGSVGGFMGGFLNHIGYVVEPLTVIRFESVFTAFIVAFIVTSLLCRLPSERREQVSKVEI